MNRDKKNVFPALLPFLFFLLFRLFLSLFHLSLSFSSTHDLLFKLFGVCNLLKMSPSLSRLAPVGNDCVSVFWSHRVSFSWFLALCLHGYFSSFSPRSNSSQLIVLSICFLFLLFSFFFLFLMTTLFYMLVGWLSGTGAIAVR
jgi:hypothetical protein